MRTAVSIVVVATLALIQVSLLPAWRPFGIVPDLMLVCVVATGLRGTVSRSLAVAVPAGILLDLASGGDFGLHTGILVLAALATGLVHRTGFASDSPLLAVILVAGLSFLSAIILLAGVIPTLGAASVAVAFRLVLITLVVNLAIAVLARPVVAWLAPNDPGLPRIS